MGGKDDSIYQMVVGQEGTCNIIYVIIQLKIALREKVNIYLLAINSEAMTINDRGNCQTWFC